MQITMVVAGAAGVKNKNEEIENKGKRKKGGNCIKTGSKALKWHPFWL